MMYENPLTVNRNPYFGWFFSETLFAVVTTGYKDRIVEEL